MALGTITKLGAAGQNGSNLILEVITMLGDDAYVAGGTAGFQATVRTALGNGSVEVMAVVPQDCGLHVPVYDKANDKLKVLLGATSVEASNGDLSGVTYNMLVICQ